MIETLIVGLGNPGSTYENTPHNLGFAVIDALIQRVNAQPAREEKKFLAQVAQSQSTLFVKPLTYMNRSGEAIQKIVEFYKIPSAKIYVVHDDFSILLGELKISIGKGAANHNGVRSIIRHLNSNDTPRFRLGVGKSAIESLETYVLQRISKEDQPVVDTLIATTVDALGLALDQGITSAMNKYNRMP